MHYDTKALTRSLYIHWPFCAYRCYFCPFIALAGHDQFMHQYHKALKAEIQHFGRDSSAKIPLDTVFIGGGTPSTCPDDLLLDTFDTLKSVCTIEETAEITIEINPGSVRDEQMSLWSDLGINRLSIGVQSLNETMLRALNRHHSVQDVYQVLDKAANYFEAISVDIMLGLPGTHEEGWKGLLHEVVTWPVKHVSLYFLMVHEYTPLYFLLQKGTMQVPQDDAMTALYFWSIEFLEQHGFAQYEVSNFARPGFASRHNKAYWERRPYKGFGLGACSFDGKNRFQNETNLMDYIDALNQGKTCVQFSEELTQEQVFMEKIMLGMRQTKGAFFEDLIQGLSEMEAKKLKSKIMVLKKELFIKEDEGRIALTPKGLLVENEIITQLSSLHG